jgi:hypothetical protein
LRIYWIIWTILTLGFAAGTTAYLVSTAFTITRLPLTPNTRVDVRVFRLHASSLQLSLLFERKGNDRRPELGNYRHRSDYRTTGYLEFADPGPPIKIRVSVVESGANHVYEALPASGRGENYIIRDLQLFVDDGNPQRFQWPPSAAARYALPQGTSNLQITALEVDPQISGEQVELRIGPPIGARTYDPRYESLMWFVLWPLYALVLTIYAAVLIWIRRSEKKHANSV